MNEIRIYKDIGESLWGDAISAVQVQELLDDMEGDITVRINSGGGDIFDGFAIYNMLAQHEGEIHVKIDALAASAASVIAMAGDTIEIAENAMMMIHNPWTIALGESKDMTKTAEILDKIRDSIVTTYQSKSPLADWVISGMMDEETWLNADESLEHGFATNKVTAQDVAMNKDPKPWMNKASLEALQNMQAATTKAAESKDASFLNIRRRRLELLADA